MTNGDRDGPDTAPKRLRIAIYDRFWDTAGGGEKFAGGIAQALAADHDVTLIGHRLETTDATTMNELAERLQLDLRGVAWREVDVSPTAVEAASEDYELFINASYGSVLHNRAKHGLYVVHFPIVGAAPPTGWRRWALRIAGRLAKMTGAKLSRADWMGGVYSPEPMGPLTHRWTDGDGVLLVHPRHGRRERVTLVFSRMVAPDLDSVTVEVRAGGKALASRSILAQRTSDGLPICFLRFRLPRTRSGPLTLHVTSPTHIPGGPSSDLRVLGVSVVAVLVGPWRQQLLQLLHQPLSVPAADLSFLRTYQRVAANSAFTARWVQRLWATDTVLLHPVVTTQPSGPKRQTILNVGRFFAPSAGHSKRQRELVVAFRRLVADGAAPGWTLHLVGGCDEEGLAYLEEVRREIGDAPVQVHVNAPAAELRALFAQASIYWHATGLGENPDVHPERMEHFGISTVEAMSAGAVPVVIGLAGQLEAFDDGVEGYHFDDLDGLLARTAELIADPDRLATMSDAARRRAARYDEAAFRTRVLALVEDVMSS